jgi:hypothetical protein
MQGRLGVHNYVDCVQLREDKPALNRHERVLAAHIVNPRDINIGMDDVGGLEIVKRILVSPRSCWEAINSVTECLLSDNIHSGCSRTRPVRTREVGASRGPTPAIILKLTTMTSHTSLLMIVSNVTATHSPVPLSPAPYQWAVQD